MSKENTNAAESVKGSIESTPQDKAKAGKWFQHGRTVADTHNYNYAIECYINGLAVWPDAVDEGHKPLRAVAFARLGAGSKKPGMFERMRFSGGVAKDPLQGMLSAEKFLARDPHNTDYLEAMIRNAHKAGCEQTCLWLGPILAEEALTNIKSHQGKLVTVHQIFEELGDRFNGRGDLPTAVQCYELAVKVLNALTRANPADAPLLEQYRNASGKLIIAKGKFESGDFRESLRDADLQRQMHDRDRMMQDEKRIGELIETAKKDLEAAPNEIGKVYAVVDLYLRRGRPEDEAEAIRLLEETHQRSKVYQFKMRADEVRLRQLRRQAEELATKGDKKAALEYKHKQIDLEIAIFKERIQQYPTDNRYKYELGKRYFQAKRYDEAVPILQLARSDPKTRFACADLIGQCFHQKGFQDQAINIFREAIASYEIAGDEINKDMHYWLGRSYEAAGQQDMASQTYGQIIQWDYDYRDVRQRLEAGQQGPKLEKGQS